MATIEQRLDEMADDIVDKLTCPGCDTSLNRMDIVEILAADEVEQASKETYKNTVGGAAAGATVGAIAGPPGIVGGAVIGSIAGGSRGQRRDQLRRVHVNCPDCSHHGPAK